MATNPTGSWPLRRLGLKVLDLEQELAYYQRLGLKLLESSGRRAVLGFEERPVLELRQLEGGRPRPRRSAGRYHFALRLPDARRRLTPAFGPFGFLSWARYHHHLATKPLTGPAAARVEADLAGLDFFEIARPELQPGTVLDPDGIQLRLTSV